MQSLTVDLNKNPEVKDAIADCEPGEELCIHCTIKSKDDQTLVVTMEEVSIPGDERYKDKKDGGNEGSDANTEIEPVGTMMQADANEPV